MDNVSIRNIITDWQIIDNRVCGKFQLDQTASFIKAGEMGRTSTIETISKQYPDGFRVLKTKNSYYILM